MALSKDSSTFHLDLAARLSNSQCTICLSEPIERKTIAFANNCLHSFCFSCLKDWSLIKPECPLCKQQLTSILHNWTENLEHEEYKVPIPSIPADTSSGLQQILQGIIQRTYPNTSIQFHFIEEGSPDSQVQQDSDDDSDGFESIFEISRNVVFVASFVRRRMDESIEMASNDETRDITNPTNAAGQVPPEEDDDVV